MVLVFCSIVPHQPRPKVVFKRKTLRCFNCTGSSADRIFTTMLGHKSSLRPMKKAAYEAGAKEAITTELCQGWTKRWAVGWTFQEGLNLRENVKPTKQVRRAGPDGLRRVESGAVDS